VLVRGWGMLGCERGLACGGVKGFYYYGFSGSEGRRKAMAEVRSGYVGGTGGAVEDQGRLGKAGRRVYPPR
jgi:hypothetical protein